MLKRLEGVKQLEAPGMTSGEFINGFFDSCMTSPWGTWNQHQRKNVCCRSCTSPPSQSTCTSSLGHISYISIVRWYLRLRLLLRMWLLWWQGRESGGRSRSLGLQSESDRKVRSGNGVYFRRWRDLRDWIASITIAVCTNAVIRCVYHNVLLSMYIKIQF